MDSSQITMIALLSLFTLLLLSCAYYEPRIIVYFLADGHKRVELQYWSCCLWHDRAGNRMTTRTRMNRTLMII